MGLVHDKYGGKTYRTRCVFDHPNARTFDYVVKSANITRRACDFTLFSDAKPR